MHYIIYAYFKNMYAYDLVFACTFYSTYFVHLLILCILLRTSLRILVLGCTYTCWLALFILIPPPLSFVYVC